MTNLEISRSAWRKSSYSEGGGGQCVEVAAAWRKSSHSGGEGQECVEAAPAWRKSSRSSGGEGQCVEVAAGERRVAVRDSKDPDGAVLAVAPSGWASLLADVKAGSLDLAR
ncbi:DUF397 domain-containing protein [Actinomadura nitritigenes]|uniref:DUF397 domain-containing protein n=1 Tax=Actinomadura nitritigenes TaxID=134602 RepID=UPI0036978350